MLYVLEYDKIWRSQELPLSLKLNIFDATCVSVFLYGSEAWSVTGTIRKTIDAFTTTAYRLMLGIQWRDRIRNVDVLKIVGRDPLMMTVVKQQLRKLGHNLRKNCTTIPHTYGL